MMALRSQPLLVPFWKHLVDLCRMGTAFIWKNTVEECQKGFSAIKGMQYLVLLFAAITINKMILAKSCIQFKELLYRYYNGCDTIFL